MSKTLYPPPSQSHREKEMRLHLTPILLLTLLTLVPAARPAAGEGVIVAVTLPPLIPVVEAVGGERVEVESLVPPGADPHHYEPSEADLLGALARADLVVMTGPSHLVVEERIKRLAERGLIKAEIIDYEDYLAEGFELAENPLTGAPNPHGYQFSISGVRAIASALARALSRADPQGSGYYRERLGSFLEELDSSSRSVEALEVRGLKVILLSPILQYVSRDLGLEVVDVVLPELDVEPTESVVAEVVEALRSGKAKLLLLSDLEAEKHEKLLKVLSDYGAPYVVVPLLKMSETPHLVPLAAASAITCLKASSVEVREGPDLITTSSVAANIILLLLVLLLMWRVRRGGA